MSSKGKWSLLFLGTTALAIVMELFAAFDGNEETRTWTRHIVEYVPGEVTALVIGGLSVWLGVHFGVRYWKRSRGKY
jgi:hypothetical protein